MKILKTLWENGLSIIVFFYENKGVQHFYATGSGHKLVGPAFYIENRCHVHNSSEFTAMHPHITHIL